MVQNLSVYAVQAIQTISNQLYWNIGEMILQKQHEYGWGKSIVEQLSKDLNRVIDDGVSWSPRNLCFMRQLVNEYSNINQAGSDLDIKVTTCFRFRRSETAYFRSKELICFRFYTSLQMTYFLIHNS
jgi:hypothetical protein